MPNRGNYKTIFLHILNERTEELFFHHRSLPWHLLLEILRALPSSWGQPELALAANHLAQLENYATLCLALGGTASYGVTAQHPRT